MVGEVARGASASSEVPLRSRVPRPCKCFHLSFEFEALPAASEALSPASSLDTEIMGTPDPGMSDTWDKMGSLGKRDRNDESNEEKISQPASAGAPQLCDSKKKPALEEAID